MPSKKIKASINYIYSKKVGVTIGICKEGVGCKDIGKNLLSNSIITICMSGGNKKVIKSVIDEIFRSKVNQ